MVEKILLPIQNSLGFALRGIRTQKDYVEWLIKYENSNLSVIVLAHPRFREVAEETFGRTGATVIFEAYEDVAIDNNFIYKKAQTYNINESSIVTEIKSIQFLRKIYQQNYPIVFDNFGQPHPNPYKPSLFVRETTIKTIKNKLINAAKEAKNLTDHQDGKVIFLPFSGVKAFGTNYGKSQEEKQNIAKFMSFRFEDSIPAIGSIQKELKKHNIIVVPISIQYGSLAEIHEIIFNLSQQHNLIPIPTSLDIDWNNNLEQQVGFFHAINQWSQEIEVLNIAIVHGSSCLHLVEECADPQRTIAFYATHSETLKSEDDGRIYHLAVAEASGGWLRAIQPSIPYSHDYKLVADQIAEQAPKAILSAYRGKYSSR